VAITRAGLYSYTREPGHVLMRLTIVRIRYTNSAMICGRVRDTLYVLIRY